jgi:hypothetical protein
MRVSRVLGASSSHPDAPRGGLHLSPSRGRELFTSPRAAQRQLSRETPPRRFFHCFPDGEASFFDA